MSTENHESISQIKSALFHFLYEHESTLKAIAQLNEAGLIVQVTP